MPATHLALQAEQRILLLRGQKVMLDFHLADLYAVATRALKQAMPRRSAAKPGVRRNPDRFPADFMFELNAKETENLRSQNVISSSHGGSRHGILAFTEQRVAMLSSVLHSEEELRKDLERIKRIGRDTTQLLEIIELLTSHQPLPPNRPWHRRERAPGNLGFMGNWQDTSPDSQTASSLT